MNSYETIKKELEKLFDGTGVNPSFSLDQPEESSHGEYATNVAFILAKEKKVSPKMCAEELAPKLHKLLSSHIEKVEVAGPGFINFFLKKEIVLGEVTTIASSFETTLPQKNGQKVMVEYTDPNCFKVFHIGHLMANTIGESISRLYEKNGYEVMRVCYPSDVGRNIALGVWGMIQKKNEIPKEDTTLRDKATFLGECYAYAYSQFEENEKVKEEVTTINQAIYAKNDEEINKLYEMGRAWSLAYFDELYLMFGTSFDAFIYESEVSEPGIKIVQAFLKQGLFEESEGAVVYKGEQDGLHTRVFINQKGLPTYEAKDLGNYEKKLELLPNAYKYVVITANEQNDYFKVINTVAQKIHPDLQGKLIHIGHGLLRLPEGKMSSRKGNVLGAEDMIEMVGDKVKERMVSFEASEEEKDELVTDIALGAIKFSILKQAPGKDTIFDLEKSISFEGDSGPYLQYTHARMNALLQKADEAGIQADTTHTTELGNELSRLLLTYPQVLAKAYGDLGPHHIVNYLLLLTRAFNSLYGATQFIDKEKKESGYYILLTQATKNILAHGLETLGMVAPSKM